MDKKLYRVDVSFTLYVLADDSFGARDLAQQHVREESPDETYATEITDPLHIDSDWRNALPYGGDEDKTCLQILEERPQPPYEDPNQQKLFV